jgi:hypothetical protein
MTFAGKLNTWFSLVGILEVIFAPNKPHKIPKDRTNQYIDRPVSTDSNSGKTS